MEISSDQVIPRIVELFDSTCIKQFESLGHDINLSPGSEQNEFVGDDMFYAHINATSEDLSASLVISLPKATLEATIPDLVKALDNYESFLVDWALELANRLMGRLKNKLISHECILNMGIPDPCNREQALAYEAKEGEAIVYHCSLQNHDFRCHLLVDMTNRNMTMDDHEDEDEDWFDESELEHL